MTLCLRYEHLIRINDPANLAGSWLTRSQLWAGLHYTVIEPQVLDESIDWASIDETSPGRLQRRIRRGRLVMADEVELICGESLCIRANAAVPFAGSTLTMRIEEPDTEMLFVRFLYEISGLAPLRDEREDNARRCAYQASDAERIRQVRRHAAAAAIATTRAEPG
jgi:hypothetical protein